MATFWFVQKDGRLDKVEAKNAVDAASALRSKERRPVTGHGGAASPRQVARRSKGFRN